MQYQVINKSNKVIKVAGFKIPANGSTLISDVHTKEDTFKDAKVEGVMVTFEESEAPKADTRKTEPKNSQKADTSKKVLKNSQKADKKER